jgi:uncharacterized protein (TIGR03435 family)
LLLWIGLPTQARLLLPECRSLRRKQTVPPLQTALEENLGLKLVSARIPTDTIVIDHVEEPTPN